MPQSTMSVIDVTSVSVQSACRRRVCGRRRVKGETYQEVSVWTYMTEIAGIIYFYKFQT